MDITKKCTGCQAELPASEFSKQTNAKDGLKYECKKCDGARAARRYAANPTVLEKNKQWQRTNKRAHREISLRHYHSPKALFGRTVGKLLDKAIGRLRDSNSLLLQKEPSEVLEYLSTQHNLPMDEFGKTWTVVFEGVAGEGRKLNVVDATDAIKWDKLKPLPISDKPL